MRRACDRLSQTQEFIERDGAFGDSVTSATVDEELRVMVEDIDDEKRLLHGAGRRRGVHTNFKVSDRRERNRRRVTLRSGQQADIRSGNSQRCKVVFQRTAHGKTSRLDGWPHD